MSLKAGVTFDLILICDEDLENGCEVLTVECVDALLNALKQITDTWWFI